MSSIIDWAGTRARMVLAFIALTLLAGVATYITLPKEGEPDIEIPMLFISVPFPGISAEDAEKLLTKPMETELSDLDGLKSIGGIAAEGYAGVQLEFEFGWDKTKILADTRDKMNTVEADFPEGADKYTVNEVNFSAFPIVIVNLTGEVPERTLVRVAKDLQDRLEGLDSVLEASLTGQRDEMVEVTIDPLRLEAYDVTAVELIDVISKNNQLIAAGEIETDQGSFAVKIPSSFDGLEDIYALPVKVNGDRVIRLSDLADIRLTFEDRAGTARFNGVTTVALQVVKRKGYNIIDTAAAVRVALAEERATWSTDLQQAVKTGLSNDQSTQVKSMVRQLEGAVMTAIALVMVVVLASLGSRSALLVGFSIPTSFLLSFIMLGLMGITISNMVMFGLILAVGMLVDGAIVIVEYADRRIREGAGPMSAYLEAAKRMFWPVVSSTATTLCAFLPMLFWPGVAGEFMKMLPITIIFVLSASLIVALIYVPVMGGVAGRMSRFFEGSSAVLEQRLPWLVRALLALGSLFLIFISALQTINPGYLFGDEPIAAGMKGMIPGAIMFVLSACLASITLGAAKFKRKAKAVKSGYRRSKFGWLIHLISGNPVMPLVAIGLVISMVIGTFSYYGANNNGTEFIGASDPEQAIVFVRARGNLSLMEKDDYVRQVEDIILAQKGVSNAFSFAGDGGLNSNTGGASGPSDSIGQIQVELIPWDDRPSVSNGNWWIFERSGLDPEYQGDFVLAKLEEKFAELPGIYTEILKLSNGPSAAKPVQLRLKGDSWDSLEEATLMMRARFDETSSLIDVEDTLPLPGIDWQINVDVEKAGRYGANVASVGAMVQLVTRGILLDTMRVDSSDEEIEIRVRLPEQDRVLSTLDSLKVRTSGGLVPLSNFISREPVPSLAQISRADQQRYFDVKAAVATDLVKLTRESDGETRLLAAASYETDTDLQAQLEADGFVSPVPVTANERIETLTAWLQTVDLQQGVEWEWKGNQEEEADSMAFLATAFSGALGLMFIILLAQFNSFYNSVLVLLAVVLSSAGVLIGMLVMGQAFSVIMTGTGIVALAGIVVNNNIVLIDTYQEYAKYMPRIEAITRTVETRIRPVLLTTLTTMAGLAPMMFGLSLDFINGGYSIDSPTASFWKQLATAVVFGLGIATVLTLVFTPSMLALRVWASAGAYRSFSILKALSMGRDSSEARDNALRRAARKVKHPEIVWDFEEAPTPVALPKEAGLRAAE
jgi:multidrug efflux pump